MQRLLALILGFTITACAAPMAGHQANAPVTVGIIAFNDFHGSLEAPQAPLQVTDGAGGTREVQAGGAARLATAIDSLRAQYAHSATVSAGDLIGASPLASALFLDEPAVGVMNRIGLDLNAVGNHEFDRGRNELVRLQQGGCEQHTMREPCAIEDYPGANFAFLAASTYTEDGSTLFPASRIMRFGEGARQVAIGFIGLTLKETEQLVPTEGIAGLRFGDELAAIDRAAGKLRSQGADAVVVLIHQGALPKGTAGYPNGCDVDLRTIPLPPAGTVDLVVSGHTHTAYICRVAGAEGAADDTLLLTSADHYGRMVTDITLTIDPRGNRVTAASARNVIVDHELYVPRDDIADYVARHAEAAGHYAIRRVGFLSGPARKDGRGGGGTLGNLIADAHLAATRSAGARIAFTNPFGIRANLEPAEDRAVTFGQIFSAQPFGNNLVTQTFTGAQIAAILEQGLDDDGPVQPLAPSRGFAYRYDLSRASGERIVSISLDSKPLDPAAAYRVTVNSFLAGGKDTFYGLAQGRERVMGGTDLDALEQWLAVEPPRKVPVEARVTGV